MDQEIKQLLEKYVRQECTAAETEKLVQFFQHAGPSDKEALLEVEEVLSLVKEKQQLKPASANRIYNEIMNQTSGAKKRSFPFRKGVQRIAAAAVVAGVLFSSLYFGQGLFSSDGVPAAPAEQFVTLELENGEETILNDTESLEVSLAGGNVVGMQQGSSIAYSPEKELTSLHYNTIRVPHGKRFELSLSDGSRVHLNAGTTLRFPVSFVEGHQREVFLSGEAFFEVAEDRDHPFVVNTGGLAVEVLGTEFNVEAYEEEAAQHVVLVEGKVNVHNKEGEALVMAPNQMVTSIDGKLHDTKVDPSRFTSWKEGYFTLRETSVAETIALLERYYHIEIRSEEEQDLQKIAGSGKVYLSNKVENVLTTLSLLTDNEYSFNYKSSKKPNANK